MAESEALLAAVAAESDTAISGREARPTLEKAQDAPSGQAGRFRSPRFPIKQ